MLTYFIQGKFDEGVELDKIDGVRSTTLGPMNLGESLPIMTSALSLCDTFYYGKINDRDIYGIYYTPKITEEEARGIIKDVAEDGNTNNIINHENTLIEAAIKHINYSVSKEYEFYSDDTIFWDTFNNVIIVADKENLIKMTYALETETFRNFASSAGVPTHEYYNESMAHAFTKKAKSFK